MLEKTNTRLDSLNSQETFHLTVDKSVFMAAADLLLNNTLVEKN